MSRTPSRSSNTDGDGRSRLVPRVVEAVTYVGVLVTITVAIGSLVGIVLAAGYGCGVVRGLTLGKTLLFFVGFGMAAYGSVLLQPERPNPPDRESLSERLSRGLFGFGGGRGGRTDGTDSDGDPDAPQSGGDPDRGSSNADLAPAGGADARPGETRFARLVAATPPARFVAIAPEDRLSAGAKILLSGVGVLAVTMVMEFGFGLYATPC